MSVNPKSARSLPHAGTMGRPRNRAKLSTTVAPENFAFLQSLVSNGHAESIAGAVDIAISRVRLAENRARLERATAAYFDGLAPEALTEEDSMGRHLHLSAGGIDFDREP